MSKSNVFELLSKKEMGDVVNKHFNNRNFEYTLLTGGLFNTTYLLEFDNRNRFVLRVGPINRHLLLPFEYNLMEAENYFCKLCMEYSIPSSNIIACNTKKDLFDRDYIIMDYIDSVPLSSKAISKEAKCKIYEETGRYAAKINSIKGKEFGRISYILQGKGFQKWSQYLQFEIDEWMKKVLDYDIFTQFELDLIREVFSKYAFSLDEVKTPNLVHADIWEGNILVNEIENQYKVLAIIDGDRCLFGDSEFELASGWMINEWFIKGYGNSPQNSKNAIIRRKIYALIYKLIDSYVCLIEYNNEEDSTSNKDTAIKILKELLLIN